MTDAGTDTTLKARILEMAEISYRSGRVLLLAQIGQSLAKHGLDIRDILKGRKMRAFLEEEMSDSLVIVQSPKDQLVFGAAPLTEKLPSDLSPYFAVKAEPRKNSFAPAVRFDRGLWLAFSSAISPDKKRVVEFGDRVLFSDISTDAVDDGRFLIERSDIASPEMGKHARDSSISENIHRWLGKHGISIDKATERVPQRLEPHSRRQESVMSLLLNSLNSEEMKRITLPLDVVSKLLSTPMPG